MRARFRGAVGPRSTPRPPPREAQQGWRAVGSVGGAARACQGRAGFSGLGVSLWCAADEFPSGEPRLSHTSCLDLTCAYSVGHVQLFATPWTVACQAPLSLGLSRQASGSGMSSPPSGDLPNPGIEPGWQARSLPLSRLGGPLW